MAIAFLDLFVEEEMPIEEWRRRDRRIPRCALRHYNHSPFYYLYYSRNEQALMNATATDHTVFANLLALFQPWYDRYTFDKETGEIRLIKVSRNG